MMKKFLILLLLAASFSTHADGQDKIWIYLSILDTRTAELQRQFRALQTQLDALHVAPKKIGDEYRGGMVFYVDETGQHGLIASKRDVIEQGIQWRNGASGNKVTNAKADGIGAGETNTRLIIAQQTVDDQKGNFAALKATNFQVLADGLTPCKTPIAKDSICYSGWYLPSAFELQLLHSNLHETNLSTFAPDFYWSSTEAGATKAWLINFSTGELMASDKSSTLGQVRAITHF